MKILFIDYFISDHKPDPWVVYTMFTLFICALLIAFFRRRVNKPLELSSTSVDNVFTLSIAIANQIRRSKDAKDLRKAVAAIGRYESEFADDFNAKQEAKDLKELLDKKASEIYGVEQIVS